MSGDGEEVVGDLGFRAWSGGDEEAVEGGESNGDVVSLPEKKERRGVSSESEEEEGEKKRTSCS